MTDLRIRFVTDSELTPDLRKEIDALDKLAFAGESDADHPELAGITWAPHDWMALGFLGDEIVTQLSMPEREISVGAQKIKVVGVGGVATHPGFQRQGYASALLGATQSFMRENMRVPFGLLICDGKMQQFYERAGWQFTTDILYFLQDDQRRSLHTCVMVLSLANQDWPAGEIDLCGSPW
jgi:aminoglycoside 2'-N-acetyltransferase I